ncbi:thermonuclease family protein [Nocardioides panacis]|uniref:Thermonuclease family protein n=1 Tax=Nocardioides panacis TaxID=2849501 RepID=A0A975SW52_9ACTN|nr:thermonuclease family protein [Nocardioides panacis]QWZ06438.1 thermonuclease family protein [Nocardioides panacis]
MLVRRHYAVPVLVLALLVAASVLLGLGAAPAGAVTDRDCGDFATQAAAQTFFLAHSPGSDPHRLDADGDGIACDSNPCPCSTRRTSPAGAAAAAVRATVVQHARVASVADGDTVDVHLVGGAYRRVRLVGIDTPEVYGGVQCGGPEASAAMKRMLPVSTRVRLVSDPTQASVDRYGRLLRYVSRVSDGRQVNRAQVYLGNARVYVYGGVPFQRTHEFRVAQAAAKAAPRGLWRTCR